MNSTPEEVGERQAELSREKLSYDTVSTKVSATPLGLSGIGMTLQSLHCLLATLPASRR